MQALNKICFFNNNNSLLLLLLFALTLLCVKVNVNAEPPVNCHLRELDLCMTSALVFVQQPEGIKASEAEIEKQCRLFKDTETCVDEFEKVCTTPMQRELNDFMTGGLFKYMSDYCKKNSALSRQYLKHGDCVNKQRKNTNKCMLDMQAAIEKASSVENADNWRDRPKLMCCALDRYKKCAAAIIKPACGDEAVEVGTMVTRGIFSRAATISCSKYKAESDVCKSILPPTGTKPKGSKSTSVLSKMMSSITAS